MAPRKKAAGKRVRSAVTGRFVKKSAAKRRPRTTVTETVKKVASNILCKRSSVI